MLNKQPLKARVAEILENNRKKILDQYYDEYCSYISLIDRKGRGIEQIREICAPVRKRFSIILDRFIGLLKANDSEYSLKESEKDEEYALRFVVPGRHEELNSHGIIKLTEPFYNIATQVVLDELKDTEYPSSGEDVVRLMNKLILIIVEDLWVGSVVGFRFQHSTIQQLLYKLMVTQEEERQRLWREIHDEFLQILAVIPLKIELIEKLVERDDPLSMQKELNLVKAIAKRTIKEIRGFGHSYNLFWTDSKGLSFSLKGFTRLLKQRFGIDVSVDIDRRIRGIKGFLGITLFRILQEGLYNIGKHSRASLAKVSIAVIANELLAVIEDNGIGFDAKEIRRKVKASQHLGLAFMQERVEILNGTLRIDSVKGIGTKIIIRIPLKVFLDKTIKKANNAE